LQESNKVRLGILKIQGAMQDWEFLLQQEGDESWLPIVDRNLELVEGKYRVVGFCKQPDLEVEIRVTFQSQEEGKFLRRSQRSRRTNHQGLVVIMPFTDLTSGAWEFCCRQSHSAEVNLQLTPQILTIEVYPVPESTDEIEAETIEPCFTSELTEDLWTTPVKIKPDKQNNDESNQKYSSQKPEKVDDRDNLKKLAEIDLFNPHKVEIETKQITLLTGQIMPAKIAGAVNSNPNRLPQLPKFSLPQVEEYVSSKEASHEELDFVDLEDMENNGEELPEDRERSSEIDEQFQSLNLKEKFWSKINNIDPE
jgi:hypothetical protein